MKIFLQKDAKENKVLVQSDQFSQEAELGKTATFDLRLEQFSLTSRPFSLEVLNLPGQITRWFRDPANEARLTQIRFNENTNTRHASLVVSLPDRPTDEVKMDASISFYVLVIPSDGNNKNISQASLTEGDIEKLAVGYVKLELVPRGKGRLLVRAQQLYSAIKADGKVEMSLELVNEGTEKLDNIEVKIDPPMNWTKKIDPAIIPALAVGEERRVTFECSPPAGTSVGRYEIRIRTSALSATQPVNAEDKTVTVEIQADANVFGTLVIVVLILGLVGGIVMFGIRLSKR